MAVRYVKNLNMAYFKNLPYRTNVTYQKNFCMRTVPSSVARGEGRGAIALACRPKCKMEKKHYVFSTFETVLCTGVD